MDIKTIEIGDEINKDGEVQVSVYMYWDTINRDEAFLIIKHLTSLFGKVPKEKRSIIKWMTRYLKHIWKLLSKSGRQLKY